MTPENLEIRLEKWKRFVWVGIGVSAHSFWLHSWI
jgi:hypothetical protein